MQHPALLALSTCCLMLCAPVASGATPSAPPSAADVPAAGLYVHTFAISSLGDSLRFNNPYRLEHQLGGTGESLSLTPPYFNLGGGVALGQPDGWQHGLSFEWSREIGGVQQHVLAPGYLLLNGQLRPWIPFARAAVPIILNPDPGVGLEAGLGLGYLISAGLGVQVQLVGDLFYGAATWETNVTMIPMLSIQAGLFVDYEVLP